MRTFQLFVHDFIVRITLKERKKKIISLGIHYFTESLLSLSYERPLDLSSDL